MKLRTKILLLTIGIILLLGFLIVIAARSALIQKLTIEIHEKGIFMSRQLAEISADYLITDKMLPLHLTAQDYKKTDSDTEYVFIQDAQGNVLAHTFNNGFPIELKEINGLRPGQEYGIQPLLIEGMRVHDIAAPIMKGKLGTAHVGISEAFIRGSVNDFLRLLITGFAGILILGGVIAIIYARKLTKPLSELVEAAKEIGGGNLDCRAHIKSRDEIGQLADTFNKMVGALRDTTVSRDYLIKAEDKARAERDKAQKYLDVAGVMLVALNENGEVALINRKGCEILGYAENEILGKNWFDKFLPERMRDEVKKVFKALMQGEADAPKEYENPVLTGDGEERIIDWRNTVLKDESGRIISALSSGEDVTGKKAAETALYDSQQLLITEHEKLSRIFKQVEIAKREWERTMDCVGDMIILTDDEGKIKRFNKTVQNFMKRHDFSDLIGADWEELIYENDLEATTLYAGSTELFQRSTGKWFELNAYPFEDVDLNFSGNVITIHETTEIKQITEQLEKRNREIEENRNKLRKALDEFSLLMDDAIQNKNLEVRFHNPNIRKCYEQKNCVKTDCPCYGKEAMRCWKVAGTFCGGKVQGAFARKFGNCSHCSVYKDATADPIFQIGEHFNNMMHILKVKNKELEDAYSELKNTQAQILQREKMASIGQLAAGVAHEINNPMGFISSNLGTLGRYINKLTEFIKVQGEILEVITMENAKNASSDVIPACRESFLIKDTGQAGMTEKGAIDKVKGLRKQLRLDYILEDVVQLIKESLDGADRVKKIVQNLKTFSRVDEAEYKHADVNECIESTLNIVWNELKYKTTVTKEYGELPLLKCYPQQLNQVFMNLLVNAAQAIEKQGEIRIKTWNGDGSINVSISDTGCGIPPDKVHKIFEPFYTTKPVGKGTGLGLSITYDIVKKHNGEIAVDSEIGKGTTFTIKIPVAEKGAS